MLRPVYPVTVSVSRVTDNECALSHEQAATSMIAVLSYHLIGRRRL